MLTVENINVSYGYLQVVWGVSLQVGKGEVVAMLGLNGAGKTTTLKSISGILKPSSGRVFFGDEDITGVGASSLTGKGLSFVPEERNLFTSMTVRENLMLGAYTLKDRARKKRNYDYVCELFPRLAERKNQLSGTMSGGERQMLAIGRGLMSSPKMIMLDEPSMGLSPQNVVLVFETIQKLKEEGVTTLIVEQNINTTLEISDRTYVMEQGRIVMEGKSEELKHNEDIQRRYLGMESL